MLWLKIWVLKIIIQKVGGDFGAAVASTLNTRQLDEFKSMSNPIGRNINIVFVINDNIERAVKKIRDLVETT